jgi:hypothetical protein
LDFGVAYVFSNKPDDPVVTAPAVAMIHISANAPNPFEQLYPELLAPPSLFFETLWLGGLFAGPPAAVLLIGYLFGQMRT